MGMHRSSGIGIGPDNEEISGLGIVVIGPDPFSLIHSVALLPSFFCSLEGVLHIFTTCKMLLNLAE